jgi:hypothetical protein
MKSTILINCPSRMTGKSSVANTHCHKHYPHKAYNHFWVNDHDPTSLPSYQPTLADHTDKWSVCKPYEGSVHGIESPLDCCRTDGLDCISGLRAINNRSVVMATTVLLDNCRSTSTPHLVMIRHIHARHFLCRHNLNAQRSRNLFLDCSTFFNNSRLYSIEWKDDKWMIDWKG